MNRQAPFLSYDVFKLIVALVLLAILILLLLRMPQPAATQAALPQASTGPAAALANPTNTDVPQPSPSAKLTGTPSPAASPAQETAAAPTATSTPEPSPTPTPQALSTATLPSDATPTQPATQPATDCPLAMPSRLKVGDTARVLTNASLRSAPEISNNLILVNPVGTQLKIIGGPVCGPYQGRAYLWWQVQRNDGKSGWSAEGALNGGYYFLEPAS